MKKIKSVTLFILCSFLAFMILPVYQGKAAGDILPTAHNNLNVGLRRSSDIVSMSDGYMRVFYNGKSVGIEYYDDSFNIKSKKTLDMELNLWGGFYAGSDAYYLVEGQNNTAESDTAEVIRVIKYDTGWRRLGAANITGNPGLFGGEVRYPFDYGCVEMTESNGTLYIVTGHEGYVDPYVGQGHQGFLMIAVDTSSMTGKIVSSDLWHSFAQYIKSKDSDLYVLEQSEGSRCTALSKYNTETFESTTLEVLPYGGSRTSAWAVACYASVDGMALSSDNVLCLGTSIDQSKYDSVSSDTAHNIYLTVTPMSDFSENATTVKWLTNYNGGGKSFLGTKITKINDNRFMVSWEEYEENRTASTDDGLALSILHYVFIDGNGNKVSREFTESTPISDCQPIVKNSKVVYYASNANTVDFYSIDAQSGKTDKRIYRVAGSNAAWDISNGVLTISGTGEISISTEAEERYPVSSTSHWFVSSGSDTAWKAIRSQVKKIVIKKGITGISERAFSGFDQLEEVEIEPGLLSIGKEAFYGCNALSKIKIPASVTTIQEDILWTGYYWVSDESHVVRATICAPGGSYAIQYAKKNRIGYSIDISEAKVSGLKSSYTYKGTLQKPKVTVKLGGATLKEDTDYSVIYKNNKNVGTATVKIEGINHYEGTILKKFKISAPLKGTKITDSKTQSVYSVTKAGSAVAFVRTKDANKTTFSIPSTVKAGGVTYKVTSVADNAFKNNKRLRKVTVSGNVTSIGVSAFQGCTVLRTVNLGANVKTIGAQAFYGCKKLTAVTLGKNVRTIGNSAFANCISVRKITIPARVEKLGIKAFYNCVKLMSVNIQTEKFTSKNIGSKAFSNVGKNNYKKVTVRVPKKKVSAYKKLLKSKGLSAKAKILK